MTSLSPNEVDTSTSLVKMTFKNGSQLFYSINNVSLDDLCTIVQHRANVRKEENNLIEVTPTVYFDTSLLARKLSTPACPNSTEHILAFAKAFTHKNIHVVLAFDNRVHRHHSKKATIIRHQECEQARIDAIYLRKKLIQQNKLLRDPTHPPEQINTISNNIKEIQKKIHTKETLSQSREHYENLLDDIEQLLLLESDIVQERIRLAEAKTQADYVIVYESLNGDCDAAVSRDGDFIVLGGEKLLLVSNFNFNKSSKKRNGFSQQFCLVIISL